MANRIMRTLVDGALLDHFGGHPVFARALLMETSRAAMPFSYRSSASDVRERLPAVRLEV